MSDGYTLDLGALADRLRDELRAELRATVRAEIEAAAWPEWQSIATAARYLDVSPERLRKLVARRAIPFHQEDVGCRISFRRRDLDDWMSGQRREPR